MILKGDLPIKEVLQSVNHGVANTLDTREFRGVLIPLFHIAHSHGHQKLVSLSKY